MEKKIEVVTNDSDETKRLASLLAPFLSPGDLLILRGPLGAGKTTFTQGLGAALKAERSIISPTFTLAREAKIRFQDQREGLLIHVDAWRLKACGGDIFAEFEALGIEDDFEGNNALIVAEWGEGVVEPLSERIIYVDFQRNAEKENRRSISFTPKGFRGLEEFKRKAEAEFGSFIN